jgi:YidC/Oxa1 family membrane protein insertase
LPELHNPNLQTYSPGNNSGSNLAFLCFALVAILLFIGLPHFEPDSASHPQTQSQPAPQLVHASNAPFTPAVQSPESTTRFGWLTPIAWPLYIALRFLVEHGVGNWGWAIILFTVAFNLTLLPTRIMAMNSSLKMMRIQPKVAELKKRYADCGMNDPRRAEMNTEMMQLYKAEGVSMYGGCLPMLLQMPLLFAYFRMLQNAAELHHAHWLWLADLSAPDPLHVLPVVIIASMFFTQLITPSPGMDPAQRRLLAFMMPAIFGFTLWRYASGVALYWATGNLINLAVQLLINRSKMGRQMHSIATRRSR